MGGFIHGRKIALLIWGPHIRWSLYKRVEGAYLQYNINHSFDCNDKCLIIGITNGKVVWNVV